MRGGTGPIVGMTTGLNGVIEETFTAPLGDGFVHALVVDNAGRLYAGTGGTSPTLLYRFNTPLTDLTNITTLTFPADEAHSSVVDMLYRSADNRIYVIFSGFFTPEAYVVQVNPDTMTHTDVIADAVNQIGIGSLCADATYLYVLYYDSHMVRRIRWSDFGVDQTLALNPAYPKCHSIRTDGTFLYISAGPSSAGQIQLQRWSKTPLAELQAATTPYGTPTDDIGVGSTHLFIGSETQSFTYAVPKGALLDAGTSIGNAPGFCHGLFTFDDGYVWGAVSNSPGAIIRIDQSTYTMHRFNMPAGTNNTNEIAKLGGKYFVSTFTNPFKIIRVAF